MLGSVRSSSLALALAAICAASALGAETGAKPAPAPARVVSINLCTDQLAMLLAAPGQLRSVTMLARDPTVSVLAERAQAYRTNHGHAEEVYLDWPDLVLAGRYTAQATVNMLRGLGIRVEIFEPAQSFNALQEDILQMGRVLGREPQARAMVDDFSKRLAALRASAPKGPRDVAATWAARGYMSGSQSLAAEIITTAGFAPLAVKLGRKAGSFLPLEALVMADPDLVIAGQSRAGHAHSEDMLAHPALRSLTGRQTALQSNAWVCGLPAVLEAVVALRATEGGTP
ncbi:cobalamin ABC transporter substrate-binding protein [Rhodobacter sp. TJ_12]|uniref:ABC transporter substrate-binding protein n=1 Tax=Rhodobacter sp. TJ_12 TaxID=2029399 RepID=UPI001CC0A448|nr:ABC transporter substrate-binding protein [Rhodobacter sp. TJ_12]MBZ4021465.1 cobalamin ABC transporter substrate-binding protein [Rhodobacter sp. TJ_12]